MKSVNKIKFDFEIAACFLIWTGSVLYSIYKLKLASNSLENADDDIYGDFAPGYYLLGEKKRDVADFEWQSYKQFLPTLTPWIALNLFISEYLRSSPRFFRLVPMLQSAVSVGYILVNFNIAVLSVTLSQPIVFQMCKRNKLCVYTCGIIFLIALHVYKNIPAKSLQVNEQQHFQSMLTIAWINLRCWSYYSDLVERNTTVGHSFLCLIAYCLYLPLLYSGPFVAYKHFEASWQPCAQTFAKRIQKLFHDLIRFLFWMLATDIFLHYVYVNAISYRPQLVDNFDAWTRFGLCYSMGQFFHLKYVVIYGVSTSLARADNIPVPPTPKCIGRIHLYSDMWKHFDNGLYSFLVRYIYMPAMNLFNLHKTMASALSFVFVFVWHGVQWNIFLWAALNYTGVTLESFGSFCAKRIRGVWRTRIGCAFAAPLLAASAAASTYFFAGTQIGDIFFKHLVQDGSTTTLALLLVLYCNCQFSNYLKSHENKVCDKK